MKIFQILLITSLLIITQGCKTTKSTKSSNDGKNNVLKTTSTGSGGKKNGGNSGRSGIVFEGENNLFELIQKNTHFFNDKSHDLIIIKGNGNIIKLYNIGIVDLSGKSSSDTLIIIGDNKKYVMEVKNKLILKSQPKTTSTVTLKDVEFKKEEYSKDFDSNLIKKVKLDVFDTMVSISFAFKYFTDQIKEGEIAHYYNLGEMYTYGIGTEINPLKAIELYEFSAVKDYKMALRRLGDLYQYGLEDLKPDLELAKYYYKRGISIGDDYCKTSLNEMLGK